MAEASSMKAAVEKMRFMVIFRFQINGFSSELGFTVEGEAPALARDPEGEGRPLARMAKVRSRQAQKAELRARR